MTFLNDGDTAVIFHKGLRIVRGAPDCSQHVFIQMLVAPPPRGRDRFVAGTRQQPAGNLRLRLERGRLASHVQRYLADQVLGERGAFDQLQDETTDTLTLWRAWLDRLSQRQSGLPLGRLMLLLRSNPRTRNRSRSLTDGGNVTGFVTTEASLGGKWLETWISPPKCQLPLAADLRSEARAVPATYRCETRDVIGADYAAVIRPTWMHSELTRAHKLSLWGWIFPEMGPQARPGARG